MAPLIGVTGSFSQQYGATPTLPTSGLVVEYRFDEGSGSTVRGYDSTGTHQSTLDGVFYSGFPGTFVTGGLQFATNNSGGATIVTLPSTISFLNDIKTFIIAYKQAIPPAVNRAGKPAIVGLGSTYSNYNITMDNDGKIVGGAFPCINPVGENILGIVKDATNSATYHYNDGVKDPYVRGGQSAPGFQTGQSYIGFSQGYVLNTTLRAIVCYNRVLSDTEVLQATLAVKHRLALLGITAKDTANYPQIITCGDSISSDQGTTAGNGWNSILYRGLTGTYRINNQSTPGYKISDAVSTQANLLGPFGLYSATPKILLLWLGTNDVAVAGSSSSSVLASLNSFVASALSAGATKVFLATILPRTDCTGANETNRQAVNTAILAGGVSGVTAVVDVNTVTGSQISGNYSDGIHPATALHASIAALWQSVLAANGVT